MFLSRSWGGSFGLRATGKLLDNYCIGIELEATGFKGNISLGKEYASLYYKNEYDKEGKVLGDFIIDVSAICSVKINVIEGNQYVEIAQYVFGPTASNGLGFFVSNLRWIDGKLEISHQSCTDFYK